MKIHLSQAFSHRITSEGAKGDKASATASGWARCVELIDLNAPKAEGKETKVLTLHILFLSLRDK